MSKLVKQTPKNRSLMVSELTHARLAKFFKFGDSMDSVINRFVDYYEKREGSEHKK